MVKRKPKVLKRFRHSKKSETPVVVIKTPKIKRSVVVSFVRVALGGLSLSLLFIMLQKPFDSSEKKVLGATNESVFKKELVRPIPVFPEISSESGIVVSTKRNKILYAKNIDLKLPPASTTKILTALLAIKEFDLDEVVEVPDACTKVEGSKMGLFRQEKIDVESLLYGLLVSSAGDAACTLSVSKFSSGEFITKMNLLGESLGLTSTTFSNPIGFDSREENNFSTARDLYLMSEEAIKNGVFRKIVGTKEITLYSSDKKYSHHISSTNGLLFEIPGTLGIKTGTTPLAKEVLVYAYQRRDDEIIIVVMGSNDRFGDTKELLQFTLENYDLL